MGAIANRISWLMALSVCILCGGCLELQQTLEIRKDGSAYVTYDYSLPLEYIPLLEELQTTIEQDNGEEGTVSGHGGNIFLNRVAVENFCAETAGVALRRYHSHDSQGIRKVHFEIEAKKAESAINHGIFGSFRLEQLEDGRQRLYAELPKGEGHLNKERTKTLKQLTEGMQVRLTVQVPSSIESSSGTLLN
ncbi:MAG: hypothetical protein J6X55_06675, partial [Victivallales bacterium]|nr:hypothetical protein [Victivallales bacterium]